MLTIRSGQVETFRRDIDASLAGRIEAFLRDELPGSIEGLGEGVLRRRVVRGMGRAREHGLETDISLIAFVAMMMEFGPRFDRHPVVVATLADGPDAPDDRMLTVVTTLPDRVWEELAILADRDWGDGLGIDEEGA